jgi:hypothetical protein
MLQRSATDFSDAAGVTEINRHIAVSHGRLNRIAQITPGCDVDFWVVLHKITNGLSHPASRANEQHVYGRRFHLGRTIILPSRWEGRGIARYPLKRFCPALPVRKGKD